MRIGLVGTYDVENFGDCYFPELWAVKLKERFENLDLTLFSPTDRAADILSFDHVRALPGRLDGRMRHADGGAFDALILTGGETIGTGHNAGTYIFAGGSLSAYLRLWLAPVLEATRTRSEPARTRLFAHAVGLAPQTGEEDALIGAALAGGDHVTLRDAFSQARLAPAAPQGSFGVAADPMFLLGDIDSADGWRQRAVQALPDGYNPGEYLVAHVSWGYFGLDFDGWVDGVATSAKARNLPVLLVPVCHFLGDEQVLELARTRLATRGVEATLARGRVNVKTTAALLGMAAGIITSSLHASVTGVVFGVPIAVLAHSMDGKHQGTLKTIGLDGVVTTDPSALSGVLDHAGTLDFAAAAARGRTRSLENLMPVLDQLAGVGPPAVSQLTPAQIETAAQNIHAHEAHRLAADRMDQARRLVFSTMRRIPGLQPAYDRFKLNRRLARV